MSRRIKTLEEFGGKRPNRWNCLGEMDYLFGFPITDEEAEKIKSKGELGKHWHKDKTNGDSFWWIVKDDIIEVKEEKKKNPRPTYKTIKIRSTDGMKFEKDTIDGKSIEDWKKEREEHKEEIVKIDSLLRTHRRLF